MCDCGCNTCETKKPALMLNESLAPRTILSEGLKHHLDANKPLTDHLYRAGSTAYFNLWAEARSYYSRGIIDITNEDDLSVLTETNLGHFGMFEGKKVPLDFPMELDEGDYDPDQEQEDDEDEIFMPYDDEGRPLGEATYEEGGEDEKFMPKNKFADGGGVYDNVRNFKIGDYFYETPSQIGKNRFYKITSIDRFDVKADDYTYEVNKDTHLIPNKVRQGYGGVSSWTRGDFEYKVDTNQISQYNQGDLSGYADGGEDDRKYALLKVRPENYNLMIDKLQDMNINHTRHSGTEGVIKVYTDRIPDKVLYKLTHDVWVDKFVLKEAKNDNKPIGKPMRDTSGGKAYKVYVKDPKTGNIKTVRFGSGGLRAKINDKKARNAFAARHKCSTRNDKTKASYWSCRLPRYAKLLGLKSSFSGFW